MKDAFLSEAPAVITGMTHSQQTDAGKELLEEVFEFTFLSGHVSSLNDGKSRSVSQQVGQHLSLFL